MLLLTQVCLGGLKFEGYQANFFFKVLLQEAEKVTRRTCPSGRKSGDKGQRKPIFLY